MEDSQKLSLKSQKRPLLKNRKRLGFLGEYLETEGIVC